MKQFIVKQSLYFCSVTLLSAMLVFFLIHHAPGDPYAGWSAALKEAFGVGRHWLLQFGRWVYHLLQFDLGYSHHFQGHSVHRLVAARYPFTLGIVFGAVIVALGIAFPLAYLRVFRPHWRWLAPLQKVIELISAVPVFISGYGVFLLFSGYFIPQMTLAGEFTIWDNLAFCGTALLILAVGNGSLIEFTKQLQIEMSAIRQSLYMRAIRARSVNFFRHLLRSVAIPLLTLITHRLVYLLSGAVVVEYIFNIPGVGLLSVEAAVSRDYPLILGITVYTVLIVLTLKTLLQLLGNRINPQLQTGGAAG